MRDACRGDPHLSVGIGKVVGGHAFQLNVSNSLGSTFGQVAQGGSEDDWFIGFTQQADGRERSVKSELRIGLQ